VKSILIDAGPLIALFDRDDRYHAATKDFLKRNKFSLVTTWPVLTEVMHMLSFSTKVQLAFLEWIRRGGLQVHEPLNPGLPRIQELASKYQDVPMDLADASLVYLAEELAILEIATIDSDYYIYRTGKKKMLRNVLKL
jgi:predicted nucleic acid-binding protein